MGRWVRWGRVLLLSQLIMGTILVTVRAQRPPPIEQTVAVQAQAFNDRASAIERRLTYFEELKIESRLAVLDKIQSDSHDTKLLIVGAIIALIGNLAFSLFERRQVAGRRN